MKQDKKIISILLEKINMLENECEVVQKEYYKLEEKYKDFKECMLNIYFDKPDETGQKIDKQGIKNYIGLTFGKWN